MTSSPPEAVDITVASATKGAATAWLVGHLGTSLAVGALTFGDANNDCSLLEVVGGGGAVHNADPVVFDSARHTTASNNEAGVGRYIVH